MVCAMRPMTRLPMAERRDTQRLPAYERRALVGAVLVTTPTLLACLAAVLFGAPPAPWCWLLLAIVVVLSVILARWHIRRITYPLYTLASLLEALREGDYTLRGAQGGALGPVIYDINALAEGLQRDRLRFEEASHLLSKTLAALDSAVFVFDETARLRLVNTAGQHLLRAEPQGLFGRTASELGLEALFEAASGSVVEHGFPALTARFEIRHAPLRREGRSGRLLVANDVGRVLRDEERQAWQRLLRVLGHEVNNSLAPIRSIAGTLATLATREPLPADWREDFRSGLDLIGSRADALARFLAGYSKLARLPPPQRREVDLAALIANVARLEQRVPVIVEAGPPLRLQADPDQIEQALINLLRNAAEAVPPQGGEVRVSWRLEAELALIEIVDNGPGPPPSENLFVPFFTTKPGGSGIGLALARQVAESHGGGVALTHRGDRSGALARLWFSRT